MNNLIDFSCTYLNKELSRYIKLNKGYGLYKLISVINDLKDTGHDDIEIANVIREMNKKKKR